MAKMFYTLDEVCQRLGKTREEIEAMVSSGQIQEFRDGESLVFKVEQIDVLAAPDESADDIDLDLSDSAFDLGDSAGIDLNASGSADLDLDLGDGGAVADPPTPLPDQAPKAVDAQAADAPGDDLDLSGGMSLEGSSIEAFDLGGSDSGSLEMTEPGGFGDELDLSAELAAPAAATDEDSGDISSLDLGEGGETRIGEGIDDDLTLESVGSGSGLLDLTRESDDTSLGAELLEEVYSSDDDFVEVPAASGLFEAADSSGPNEAVAGSNEAVGTPVAGGVAVAAQAWDPAGSGLSAGMCIGALVCLLGVFAIVGVQLIGGSSGLAPLIAEKLWIWTGGIAGGTVLLGLIGLLIGKRGG